MKPVPVGIDPTLKAFLDELRQAVTALQSPNQPQAEAALTFAQLPDAADYKNRRCLVTDKHAIAVSTYDAGSSSWKWTRSDGSAL